MTSLLIFISLLLLVAGGEMLVKGASRLAEVFNLSPLVIGLTVVAFGTSAPELAVSLIATMKGSPEIAISNVVGSNIFNICFILGVCALVSPLHSQLKLLKIDFPILVIVSALALIASWNGMIGLYEGVSLVLMAVVYTIWLIQASHKASVPASDLGAINNLDLQNKVDNIPRTQLLKSIAIILSSLAVLVFASRLLVENATELARYFQVSEKLIGLTIVAAGTSLPELATSLMATLRGEKDIAIGNVVGSNIFNILLILGLSSAVSIEGLPVSSVLRHVDLPIMLAVTFLCYPLLWTEKKLSRPEGGLLLLIYISYLSILFLMSQ